MLVWLAMDKIRGVKPSVTGACVGSIVGLVAITPACGYLSTGGTSSRHSVDHIPINRAICASAK